MSSETKKALGRKSKRIGKENRGRIYLILTKEPLTFSELLDKSGVSRSTLSNHLKDLIQDKRIEKVLDNDQIVYKANLEKEKIIAELRIGFATSLYSLIPLLFPSARKRFDEVIDELADDILAYGKEEAFKRLNEKNKNRVLTEVTSVETEKTENKRKIELTESRIADLSRKFPKAMKELLEENSK